MRSVYKGSVRSAAAQGSCPTCGLLLHVIPALTFLSHFSCLYLINDDLQFIRILSIQFDSYRYYKFETLTQPCMSNTAINLVSLILL